MSNRKNTAICLSKILKESLLRKFGKIPSANTIANQFNLRAYGTKTITRETARKWVLGLSVPEIDKLVILIEWLNIDASVLFASNLEEANHLTNKQNGHLSQVDFHINNCLKDLTDNSKKTILLAIWMIKQLQNNNFDLTVCEKLISDHLSLCSSCKQKLKKII